MSLQLRRRASCREVEITPVARDPSVNDAEAGPSIELSPATIVPCKGGDEPPPTRRLPPIIVMGEFEFLNSSNYLFSFSLITCALCFSLFNSSLLLATSYSSSRTLAFARSSSPLRICNLRSTYVRVPSVWTGTRADAFTICQPFSPG